MRSGGAAHSSRSRPAFAPCLLLGPSAIEVASGVAIAAPEVGRAGALDLVVAAEGGVGDDELGDVTELDLDQVEPAGVGRDGHELDVVDLGPVADVLGEVGREVSMTR